MKQQTNPFWLKRMWLKLGSQRSFSLRPVADLSTVMASSPPPPPPKGKGKHSATDALRTMAGFETTKEVSDAREAAAKARSGLSLKRKVEDLLPQFTVRKGGLVSQLQKAAVTEYFPFCPNELGRQFYQLINGAMIASAKYGTNRTIPFLLAVCDLLVTHTLILRQYCSMATTRTMTVVAGDQTSPDATDKAALINTIDRMELKMVQPNTWVTKLIGISEDSQHNVLAPFFKYVAFRHDGDPRPEGTVTDLATANTFDGVLAFTPQYQVYAEGCLTPVEIQLMIMAWFNGLDFAAMVALIVAMCFGAARANEVVLQRRFFPFQTMYNQPLPAGADAFTGQLVQDLPSWDQFIEKVYAKKDAAELILLSSAQFSNKLYNAVAGESGITKLAPQSMNGVALTNCAYSHIFLVITTGNWAVDNARAMPNTFAARSGYYPWRSLGSSRERSS